MTREKLLAIASPKLQTNLHLQKLLKKIRKENKKQKNILNELNKLFFLK